MVVGGARCYTFARFISLCILCGVGGGYMVDARYIKNETSDRAYMHPLHGTRIYKRQCMQQFANTQSDPAAKIYMYYIGTLIG